jgi:hypothetical protein
LELTHTSASSFADNTRVLMKITDDLDCERLQEALSSIYDWTLVKNMQLNGTKFNEIQSLHRDWDATSLLGIRWHRN